MDPTTTSLFDLWLRQRVALEDLRQNFDVRLALETAESLLQLLVKEQFAPMQWNDSKYGKDLEDHFFNWCMTRTTDRGMYRLAPIFEHCKRSPNIARFNEFDELFLAVIRMETLLGVLKG